MSKVQVQEGGAGLVLFLRQYCTQELGWSVAGCYASCTVSAAFNRARRFGSKMYELLMNVTKDSDTLRYLVI